MKRLKARLAAVVTCAAVCGPSYGLELDRICRAARAPQLNDVLTFMTSGDETCTSERCFGPGAILEDKVFVETALAFSEKTEIGSMVAKSSVEATSIISNTLGISFSESFDEADTFIFLLVVSERFSDMIGNGKIQEIDAQQFNSFILPALSVGKCAGIVTHVPEGELHRIKMALIFFSEALETEQEVRSCVFEEIMNASGLFRDPPGSASLFDNFNYSRVDG